MKSAAIFSASSFLLLLSLAMLAGCTGPQPPGQNATNGTVANQTNTTGNYTIPVPPGYEVRDYCEQDPDCVRLKKCCDCGAGEYVNIYNQDNPSCTGPQCLCAIQDSVGVCRKNRCVAVPVEQNSTSPPPEQEFYFRGGQGKCGNEVAPTKNVTPSRTVLSGSIAAPSPCFTANATLASSGNNYTLSITVRAITGVDTCINCVGAIPWIADINGSDVNVDVYYNGVIAYSDFNQFCGWSAGECDTDSECRPEGCSSEVCGSTRDTQIFTSCIYRDCYNAYAYKMSCGCVNRKCAWRSS